MNYHLVTMELTDFINLMIELEELRKSKTLKGCYYEVLNIFGVEDVGDSSSYCIAYVYCFEDSF